MGGGYLVVTTYLKKKLKVKRIIEVLTVVIILISMSCSATNECEKLLSEKINTQTVLENKHGFTEKVKLLIECEFDSVDNEVLFGNDDDGLIIDYLFQIFEEINKNSSSGKVVTFKEIKELIEELTKSEEYKIGRQIVIAKNQIIDRPAKTSSWNEDYKLLIQMNLTESDIVQIKKIVEENESKNWTYFEVLQELMVYYETTNTMECPIPSYHDWFALPHNLDGYFELSEGMECSKISNKPILLYFSGHGSIKSREFEAYVMSDDEILKLLNQKFIITNLNVDDRSNALPKYYIYSGLNNDTIKQKGKINQYYQKELFNENIVPSFYIIDSLGKQIQESYYFDKSIDSYKEFLEKGLEIYYKQ